LKKAVLLIMAALMAVTIVATPVLAAPSESKKIPVALQWTNVGPTINVERRDVDGGISHRILIQNWEVKLFINGAETPIVGAAVGNRQTVFRYAKEGGVDQIMNDYYVISFPTEGGGFEGNAHITLTDWDSVARTYNVRLHVVLQGTGEFEGQTLNAWQIGPGTNHLWEGYILKR
jgi:hypothetical protein